MLYVTGQQLYECDELQEWKEFIDNYQRYWHDEEDKRFRNSYAIVQEANESNLDENGYYKHLCSPSEWIT